MFDYLRGTLVHRKPARVVVDVGGVGYELFIPLSTYTKLPPRGEEATVLTHYHLRDDAVKLFGFATLPERTLFRTLIAISGVGPAVALGILSSITIRRFSEAVENGDEKALTRIKGIGKKTAQRLIVELSGRLPQLAPAERDDDEDAPDDLAHDAKIALETLGVAPDKAEKAITKALKDLGAPPESVDILIRAALRFS